MDDLKIAELALLYASGLEQLGDWPARWAEEIAMTDGIAPQAVIDTFDRAIETNDFERPLRLVKAGYFTSWAKLPAGTASSESVLLQPIEEILLQTCCRWRGEK